MVSPIRISRGDAAFAATVVVLAIATAALAVTAPRYGLEVVAVAVAGVAVARAGTFWIATIAGIAIPVAIVYSNYAPHGLRTALAGIVAVSLLIAARPIAANRALIWANVVLVVLIAVSAFSGDSEGRLEAERMILFPIMVLALSSVRAPELVDTLRRRALISSGIALTGQIVLSAAGMVKASSYYGVGEDLGLASRPHELAFLGAMTACGALLVFRRGWLAFSIFGVASYVVVDSGVRTGVLAIGAFIAVKFLTRRRRPRDLLIVAAGALVVLKTNAINVLMNRFNAADSHGGGLTSHRSEIWSNAFRHFRHGDVLTWLTGTGLGSVMRFSAVDLDLGDRGPSHSDIVSVGIQLGLFGIAAYALIWLWFVRRLEYAIVLVPVAIFAFGNGLIDRTDAMVFALLIAGAKATSSEGGQTTNHFELPSE